jgi:hypothetical protein
MRGRVWVPVKVVGRDRWGDLTVFGNSHDICGTKVSQKDNNFPFAGGHRVRLYRFTTNVHWLIPTGVVEVDITDVTPASPPPRRAQRR